MNKEQDRNNDLPKSTSTDSEEALNNETKCDSLEISKNQEHIDKCGEKTIPEVKPVDSTSQEQNTITSGEEENVDVKTKSSFPDDNESTSIKQ